MLWNQCVHFNTDKATLSTAFMPSQLFKPVVMKPLVGLFDNRSNVDETPPGAFRWIENFVVNKDSKLSRAKGFTRAFPSVCPRNEDYHFQGDGVDREPITMFFPSTANNGTRRLFAATKSRILLLNESNVTVSGTPPGHWQTLASSLGADDNASLTQLRFSAAELKNKVFFTNDFDRVKMYDIDAGTFGDAPGLSTSLDGNVRRARRVISWNGVILLLNTFENATQWASRIRWSDLNDGEVWNVPIGSGSISDYQDLDYSHIILAAVSIGNFLYVFTDRSIWRCRFVVDQSLGTAALDCVKVYDEPRNHAKCLVFPNTLISNGRSAFYLGSDGWYEFNPGQMSEPERPEWAHRSTKIIFSGARAIDTGACASPVSEYRPDEDTIYLSWGPYRSITAPSTVSGEIDCDTYEPAAAPMGTGLNNWTLAFNLKHRTAALISHGSVAYANFAPDSAGVGGCNTTTKFLGSDPTDWTVKELLSGYAREMYDPVSGLYASRGYFSTLRFIFPFERYDENKELRSFLADLIAEDEGDPAVLRMRLGTSDRAVDLNLNGKCDVLWHRLSDKAIKCGYSRSAAQYVADNVRPDNHPVEWSFLYRAKFMFCELVISAADGSEPTGGGCVVSRFETSARLLG